MKLLVAAFFLLNALGGAFACEAPSVTGMPYHLARGALIAIGWHPDRHKENYHPFIKIEWIEESGYTEALSCAGTGLAPCVLTFSKDGNTLSVTTQGEFSPIVSDAVCEPKPDGTPPPPKRPE